MSADNGLYLLKTSGPVWRVGYVIAVSNLDYFRKLQPGSLSLYLISGWGNSPRFNSLHDAEKYAIVEAASHPPLEYGISEIDMGNYTFPGD